MARFTSDGLDGMLLQSALSRLVAGCVPFLGALPMRQGRCPCFTILLRAWLPNGLRLLFLIAVRHPFAGGRVRLAANARPVATASPRGMASCLAGQNLSRFLPSAFFLRPYALLSSALPGLRAFLFPSLHIRTGFLLCPLLCLMRASGPFAPHPMRLSLASLSPCSSCCTSCRGYLPLRQ